MGVTFGGAAADVTVGGPVGEEGGSGELHNSGATGSGAVGGGATDEPADLFEAINVSIFSANDCTLL